MRRNPRSRGSASSEPPDPYPTALALLGQRELSEAQLRARLLRRGCEPAAVDDTILRLRRDRTLDDRRVASAAARLEAGIRGRGPARVRQRLQAMGLASDVVHDAVAEVFREVDQDALLDAALERGLRGQGLDELDDRGRARLVRGLVGRGFSVAAVLKKLKA